MHEETGAAMASHDVLLAERTVGKIRETLDEAAFAAAWADGPMLTDDEVAASLPSAG